MSKKEKKAQKKIEKKKSQLLEIVEANVFIIESRGAT